MSKTKVKTGKRITLKPKNPNPLFEQWLTEWRDKAKESESKMQFCFALALKSLKKYPLPLQTGKDCKILNGFGATLCRMLDDKLAQYNDTAMSQQNDIKNSKQKQCITPEKAKSKEYIPQYKSGAFAILITLYEELNLPHNNKISTGSLDKSEIIKHAHNLCNSSFTRPEPGSRYTAWSSMKILLEKNLVEKQGNPAKFRLTPEGVTLADKLYIQHKIQEFEEQQSDQQFSKHNSQTQKSSSTTNCIIFPPNSFEIILLIDMQEKGVKLDKLEEDPLYIELKKLRLNPEFRALKVGDYIWICRDRNSSIELTMPYIVERKRMDDLGSSIKDGRYNEQKFRLKQCGIPNLIYLIENYGKNEHVGLPINNLFQAATNTLIQDGFVVHFTENLKHTAEFLASLTKTITKCYKGKTLVGCTRENLPEFSIKDDLVSLMQFQEFNKISKAKALPVRDMFIKQLLCIKGMSVDKAIAIIDKYPTPKSLKLVYNNKNQAEGEKLLSNIQFGTLGKNIGPLLSKIIYQFYCQRLF